MPPAWECLFAKLGSLVAPGMNGGIAHTQLAGNVRDRLPARLGQSHRFFVEFPCGDFVNLCQC
jgi:hypothetical protein